MFPVTIAFCPETPTILPVPADRMCGNTTLATRRKPKALPCTASMTRAGSELPAGSSVLALGAAA